MIEECLKLWWVGVCFSTPFVLITANDKDPGKLLIFKIVCWPIALAVTCYKGLMHHMRQ